MVAVAAAVAIFVCLPSFLIHGVLLLRTKPPSNYHYSGLQLLGDGGGGDCCQHAPPCYGLPMGEDYRWRPFVISVVLCGFSEDNDTVPKTEAWQNCCPKME